MHRVRSDEIFHFYFGDPVQMLLLYPSGESRIVFMGHDMPSGQKTQLVVPKGTWQGCMVLEMELLVLLSLATSLGVSCGI